MNNLGLNSPLPTPRKTLLTMFVAGMTLFAAVPAVAESAEGFRYVKPLERKDPTDEEIIGFALDSDIYAATRNDLPDLRILDASGAETAYQIEPAVEMRKLRNRHSSTADVLSLKENAGTIEVQVALPKDVPSAEGLTFSTPLTDYVRKVQVFGLGGDTQWTPLVTDGTIYDYSRFMDVSRHDVALPKNDFRTFKIIIENVTDEKEFPTKELARTFHGDKEQERVERTMVERRPLRIDRISAWYQADEPLSPQPKRSIYPLDGTPEVEQDAKTKQTIVTIKSHREPLRSFTLQTADRNFHRAARVEVPLFRHGEEYWMPIGSSAVWNFHFRNENREQLVITFPETRVTKYRIVIENEDNRPISIDGVRAEGAVYQAVFLARSAKPYRVVYGSATAPAPRYDVATVLSSLRRSSPLVDATLGRQSLNAGHETEAASGWQGLLNNWYFLGTAIGAMVLVLGWGLFRAGRRVAEMPEQ